MKTENQLENLSHLLHNTPLTPCGEHAARLCFDVPLDSTLSMVKHGKEKGTEKVCELG